VPPSANKFFQLVGRFAPPVARGLALGFAILAIATVVFGMGDYASDAERYWVAGVYGAIAGISFFVSRAIDPLLRGLRD
jgi:hypothetical protein